MQEKVQFFNSESSFGSESSLANSRYYDLTNQISEEVQILFMTLRKQFLPTKQLTNYQKIQYLINRSHIIASDTIPDHLNYLEKISSPTQTKDQCKKHQQDLNKLILNFQSLKNGSLTHKQFYNIYCRTYEEIAFVKKAGVRSIPHENLGNGNNCFLQPDVVEVNLLSSRQYNPYQTEVKVGMNINKTNSKDKELKQLQDEISRMKKREQDLKRQADLLLNNQKFNNQQRVNNILEAINTKTFTSDSHVQIVKNELAVKHNQLQYFLSKNNQLIGENQTLKRKCQHLQQENQSLNEQLAKYRKLQLSNIDQREWDNKSVYSQLNASNVKDSKKMSLNIKKLQGERDILKSQLLKEREKNYSDKLRNTEDQSRELVRLKKKLEETTKQYQQTLKSYDKVRVQMIQLRQQNQNIKKECSMIRQSKEQEKYRNQKNNASNGQILGLKSQKMFERKVELEISKVQMIKFSQYQGQGIEGIPYFELLSKQFRIRFKRACLKEKELLYKANNLQVGVITEFFSPNFLKIFVHLTNYGDKNIINMKLKLMNPNQNKLECEIQEIKILNSNQQIKLPISCLLKNYPIGPVVLLLDYEIDTVYELRLLLPVHIFKCVNFSQRSEKMIKPTSLTIKVERKICKDFSALKQYFNCSLEQSIKVKVRHQHSNSSLFLDAFYQNEQIRLIYEHIQGYNNFTEYFIKTLKTLLQKQH